VQVVLPSAPREEAGLYWGYATRLAKGISGLVQGAPFEGGYDLKLGTSEHGQARSSARGARGRVLQGPCFWGGGGETGGERGWWSVARLPLWVAGVDNRPPQCAARSHCLLFTPNSSLGHQITLPTLYSNRQVVLPGNLELPRFKHLLIAFGGPEGLEDCLAHDKRFTKQSTTDVFDLYLNTCPGQGSRTIRTEEAVLISMAYLQTAVVRFGER
jgi:hypothetical protein